MKKLLLLFIVISFSLKTKAQVVFCPPGAKWHYAFLWPFNWHTQNLEINYLADTLIGGEIIKVLSAAKFYLQQNCQYASRTFIKQRGDTIFMNNDKTMNGWQILYNFAALSGHNWQTTFLDAKNIQVTYTVSVDSVTTVSINSFPLKRLHVKYWSSPLAGQPATITERLGCNKYLFNYHTQSCVSDADKFDKFLCYRDDNFGIKQFTDTACNFTDKVGINEFESPKSPVVIYPNPVSDFLLVKITGAGTKKLELSLSDLQGKELKRIPIKEKDKINLSDLKSGMYLVILTRDKEIVYKEKLIKE